MVRVRRKVAILVALLIISLSTVTFLTVKYVHTVRLFNSFYQSARETAEKIDAETAVLQEEITVLQQNIDYLNEQLESVTAERNVLAEKLANTA
jgi:Skp family chaperone for outer membrane proteins